MLCWCGRLWRTKYKLYSWQIRTVNQNFRWCLHVRAGHHRVFCKHITLDSVGKSHYSCGVKRTHLRCVFAIRHTYTRTHTRTHTHNRTLYQQTHLNSRVWFQVEGMQTNMYRYVHILPPIILPRHEMHPMMSAIILLRSLFSPIN